MEVRFPLPAKFIVVSCEHEPKAQLSIETRLFGKVMLLSELQCSKQLEGISIKPTGRMTSVSLLHPLKAESPINLTVDGNVIFDNVLQSINAHSPIDSNPSGKTTFFKLGQA